jgi:hypothetical protein
MDTGPIHACRYGSAVIQLEDQEMCFINHGGNSHQRYTAIKTRFIRPDVAVVDVCWDMTGATDAQGNPRPDRRGLLNFTMQKNAGQWQIVAMHNLDLTALRLSTVPNSATKSPQIHRPSR